ncbi:MAG: PSD1 domain-containing protein [Planctomycetes bacterium]|nr:PSD1 domain-containing protein [Planctomycetota bacterium]
MQRRSLLSPFLLLLVVPVAHGEDKTTLFREQVRPILQRCVHCHSGDEPASGLNLSTRPLALKGGESGPALRPGRARDSLLFSMVSSKKMPPKKSLGAEEIALLRRWIDDGATWEGTVERVRKPVTGEARRAGPDWWSLQKVRRPSLPSVKRTECARTPVDTFVLAALEAKDLSPAPPADRATLLRRVTFDLTGLPPTLGEVDAFLKDQSPDAFEKVVERLLASPHYGERWGRHWLDVARFGESQGFERDKLRDHAWRYRDWVVRSFNDDKPYPQFIKEQLAGDVPHPHPPPPRGEGWGGGADGIVATGFLVAGPWDEVGATQQGVLMRMRVREEELEDMVSATAQAFLGLTVNCARCHDHKFDPILQKDYYRLKAALEGVRHGDQAILTPAQAKKRDAMKSRGPPPMAYAANPVQPGPTHVLIRGDIEKKGTLVSAGGLSAIKEPSSEWGLAPDAPEGLRRLKLAEWIASPEHPLTARVMVNRVWQWHFGRGLVETPSDFGFNGGKPTHPELLDWLASEFTARGWSIKSLHRLIVLSNAYQQSSRFNARAAAVDADNRLLWRFEPRRLEGEAVRDAMLAASGELNQAVGGPSFRPFTVTVFNSHFYTLTDPLGPEFNRRTIYRMNVNSAKSPLLDAFDCPDPSVKMPRRSTTTTPLQALALMNNSFVLRQARYFATRVQREAGVGAERQVALAYRLALGRGPKPEEARQAVALVREHGLEGLCWALLNASEFLYAG